jgi:hypothetical protein
MISGENPRYPSAPGGHDALKRDLDTMGVQHEETQGHYGSPERSFLIYGLPREHLVALGQKYGQEAVIHNEGGRREFIYTAGPNAGKMHPGLNSFDHWPEGSEAPDDYYTHLPGNGYVRLHFDFDHTDTTPVMPGAPQPAPLSQPAAPGNNGTAGVPQHVAAEPQMTKHEALRALYRMAKSLQPDAPFKHPHAYQWHDGHSDHHYRGHGPGGVLISSKLRKHDAPKPPSSQPVAHPHTDGAIPGKQPDQHAHATNDQSAKAGVKTYAQYALPFGHIDHDAKARGGSNLFHYDYNGKNDAVNKLVADHGFSTYYAGGKYGKPDLANRNYNTKHLMVYDPSPDAGSSFGDQTYTDSWRKTHELSHALVYPELNQMYGEGRRIGKLGAHRTLNEALRAVHWEWLAAHKQRDLNKQLGIHVPDETFNRELNTVMHDAAHRAVTGKFTEPSEEGFVPHSHAVPLETSLGLVREAARNLGLTGMHDLVKKSEGAIAVADQKKSLTQHEALHGLYKGLTDQVKTWEQQCLDLRKAELAKSAGRQPKFLHSEYKRHADAGNHHDAAEVATALHHFHSEALQGNHGNHNGDHDAYHDKQQQKWHSLAAEHRAMASVKKAESDDAKLEAYAKGELKLKKNYGNPAAYGPGGGSMPKPAMSKGECKGTALCKCSGCEGMDKYAKGEKSMTKVTPSENKEWASMKQDAGVKGYAAGTGPVAKKPSAADKQWASMKQDATKKGELPAGSDPAAPGPKVGVTPDDKKSKEQAPKSAEGSGGAIKKAGMPAAGGAPPKAPGAAGPAAGGMPKPAMPKLPGAGGVAAAGPKLPKPAGAPKPAGGAPALKSEMKKAVVPPHAGPFAARAEASGKVSADPMFSAHAAGGPAPSPFSAPPAIPAQAKIVSSAPAPARAMSSVVSSAPAPQMGAQPSAKLPMVAKKPATPPPLPANALQAPPAHARPGAAAIALPGAHLFGKQVSLSAKPDAGAMNNVKTAAASLPKAK